MAYTNAWSVTVPAGTELASTIDDHLRRLRLDIQERMNSIVVDWTADPVSMNPLTMPLIMKDGGAYSADGSIGSKASDYLELTKVLSFILGGTTDANGEIVIDLDEYNAPVGNVADYFHVVDLRGVVVTPRGTGVDQKVYGAMFIETTWLTTNQIAIQFHGADDSLPLASTTVQAYVTLFFRG